MYGLNPKRRRRHGKRRHSRRRYRRNPAGAIGSQVTEAIPKIGWGVAGALGTELIPSFLGRFVPLPSGRAGVIAVKAGTGIGIAFLLRRFVGRAAGNAALVGAGLSIALDPVRNLIAPFVMGAGGAAAGIGPEVGAYLPAEAYLSGGVGYIGPGGTFGDIDEPGDAVPDRLDAMARF